MVPAYLAPWEPITVPSFAERLILPLGIRDSSVIPKGYEVLYAPPSNGIKARNPSRISEN